MEFTVEHLQEESLNAAITAKLRPDGIYEPAPDDPAAYPVVIAGVRPDGCCGWPIDLVAWQPAAPDQWWRRLGTATHLGDGELWRPTDRAELLTWRPAPVLLVETPAQWVHEACCKAVCILDWERADVVDMFHLGRPVTFYSDRLRRKFDRRWGEIVEAERAAAVPRYKVSK